MLSINGTTIYLTRGDTARIQLTLTDTDGNAYEPSSGDSIRFAMKRFMTDSEEILLEKAIPTDTLILEIEPSDTQELKYSARPYAYDVELTTSGGAVDTFIADADFYLTAEADVYD